MTITLTIFALALCGVDIRWKRNLLTTPVMLQTVARRHAGKLYLLTGSLDWTARLWVLGAQYFNVSFVAMSF